MTESAQHSQRSPLHVIFGVFIQLQTYLNILYLLLAFPLGIGYFVFLVTGLALGLGLFITWFGVVILLLVLGVSWALTVFERELAIRMLGIEIPPMARGNPTGPGIWRRLVNHLANPVTWTGLIYLIFKFPAGVSSFVITVVLLSVPLGFVTAPIYYRWAEINFGFWRIDSLPEALALVPIGFVVGIITPHVLNFAAFLSGRFAYIMLGAKWSELSSRRG
ncbi:MAG: sensor domain-containing protein [Chloroflexi bacterium]|nr:sensor domain-containing protein [Chloroflexota bacterium]